MSDTGEDLVNLSHNPPKSKMLFTASCPDHFPYMDVLGPKPETSPKAAPASQLRRTLGLVIVSCNDELQARADELGRSNKIVEDKMKQMKLTSTIKREYGNVVVIQPLPESITKRDILCRVRGSKVLCCILSRFRDKPIAVVKFQDLSSAQHYVDFCAEDFTQEIWTFPAGPGFLPYTGVTMTSRVRIYNEAPGLGSTWHTADIPVNLFELPSAATRCLVLRHCPVEQVPRMWAGLGLQRSQHLQDQLEDIWLDQPEVDHAGGKATGTLHVWFSDINTAALVKQRYYGPLEYESDPCSAMPEETFILGLPELGTQLGSQQPTTQRGPEGDSEYTIDVGSEDRYDQLSELCPTDVYIHYHSFPFVSLLDLEKLSIMDGLCQGLLDPIKLLLHSSAPGSEEVTQKEKVENMGLADRLIDALQRHRFGQTTGHRGMRRARVWPSNNAIVSAPVVTQSDQCLQRGTLMDNHRRYSQAASNPDFLAKASDPRTIKPGDPPCVAARPVPVGTEPGRRLHFTPPPNGDCYEPAEYYANRRRGNSKFGEPFHARQDDLAPGREREHFTDTTEPVVSNNPDHKNDTSYQSGRLVGSGPSF